MPELPEVEVTRLTVGPHVEHQTVQGFRLGLPLRWPLGVDPQRVAGHAVGALQRRGKYLWMPLVGAQTPAVAQGSPGLGGGLLVHLGMSGTLQFHDHRHEPALGRHEHAEWRFAHGRLVLNDPRRFGAVVWSPSLQHEPARRLLARLGKEPDDPALDGAWFHAQLQGRRTPIKSLLLSGEVVVGAGNIYACEALFEAGIHPELPAARLSRRRADRLLAAVQHTLRQALALGGSTLRDFKDAHGLSGAFQDQARVYGREGLPCVACGRAVRRVVLGQRSTFFCAGCQRR